MAVYNAKDIIRPDALVRVRESDIAERADQHKFLLGDVLTTRGQQFRVVQTGNYETAVVESE